MEVLQKPEFMDPAVFDKLMQSGLSTDLIREVIDVCDQANDEPDLERRFDSYCDNKKQEGTPQILRSYQKVGHLKDRDATITFLTSMIPLDVKKVFEALEANDPGQLHSEINTFFLSLEFSTNQIFISQNNPWVFINGQSDVYTGEINCFPARLALPAYFEGIQEFIGFEVDTSYVTNAREPKIFDAGYYFTKNIWSPGGMTVPLKHKGCPKCDKEGGFRECVSDPILFQNVSSKAYKITIEKYES